MNDATALVVRKAITVRAPIERAFEVFTAQITTWWPLREHSIGEALAESVTMEGREGGRLFECQVGGGQAEWGTVTIWDPPHRVSFTWHPGRDPVTAQEVDVRFSEEGSGTRVELEHRGWEKLGERAAEAIQGYESGWERVFGALYAEAAGGPVA
jgi:uncharacterized protein YndB with AHSA1/START domain